MSKVIAIDFDGVIRKERTDTLCLHDQIYPEAVDFINKMLDEKNIVIIFTARDISEVQDFLKRKCDLPFVLLFPFIKYENAVQQLEGRRLVGITSKKFPADVYIDDNAYTFKGDWKQAESDLEDILKSPLE